MTRVVLHIDRLVLNGFAEADRQAIAQGLREQLSEILMQPGVARHWVEGGSRARLKVAGVPLEAGAPADGIGAQVAQGIAREIAT